MFLAASGLNVHIDFDIAHPFFSCPSQKIGRVEVNLSSPARINDPSIKALEMSVHKKYFLLVSNGKIFR